MNNEEIQYLSHEADNINRFACKFFIDIRVENEHFKTGDLYNHFIGGKMIAHTMLVNISYRFLDVLPDHFAYLCYGTTCEMSRDIIKRRFWKTHNHIRIDFKKSRLAILVFENIEREKEKFVQQLIF